MAFNENIIAMETTPVSSEEETEPMEGGSEDVGDLEMDHETFVRIYLQPSARRPSIAPRDCPLDQLTDDSILGQGGEGLTDAGTGKLANCLLVELCTLSAYRVFLMYGIYEIPLSIISTCKSDLQDTCISSLLEPTVHDFRVCHNLHPRSYYNGIAVLLVPLLK